PGEDYLIAKDGNDMGYKIAEVLKSAQLAQSLSQNGRKTIWDRHTCAHRVDALEDILKELGMAEEKIFPIQHKTMEA
ncbi:glycosyltransferase family protein, partial [Tamlana crocina]